MRISDWSSDVCSSDLPDRRAGGPRQVAGDALAHRFGGVEALGVERVEVELERLRLDQLRRVRRHGDRGGGDGGLAARIERSEERRVGKECGSKWKYRWVPYR